MIKLKQIAIAVLMAMSLLCSVHSEAAGCAKNQWLNGKKCAGFVCE